MPVLRLGGPLLEDRVVSTHTCHWLGCGRAVPPRMWGCREHWFRLPRELRARIRAAYRPGQETDKKPSAEYLQAAGAVRQWIGAHR